MTLNDLERLSLLQNCIRISIADYIRPIILPRDALHASAVFSAATLSVRLSVLSLHIQNG